MKKNIVLFLVISCFLTACTPAKNEMTTTESISTEIPETTESSETVETFETTENSEIDTVVYPLPVDMDLQNLKDGTFAVSFGKEDILVDEKGTAWMTISIFVHDLYDDYKLSSLNNGDIINIRKEDIEIVDIDHDKASNIFINGGLENGGYDFYLNENGFYYEHGYSDTKYWYELGKATIKIDSEFEYIDSSDLDKEATTYYLDDFTKENSTINYNFTPHGTKITVKNGKVISMKNIYTP